MADDIRPEQQPLKLYQGVNVLRNPFDFVVGEVQLPQVGEVQQALWNVGEFVAAYAEPFQMLKLPNPRRQAVDFVFVEDDFSQLPEPSQPHINVFPLAFCKVQAPHLFRALKCRIVVRPNLCCIPGDTGLRRHMVRPKAHGQHGECHAQRGGQEPVHVVINAGHGFLLVPRCAGRFPHRI